jgi:hypothetical protein
MFYEEFIGKEPSLNKLEKFIRINKNVLDEFNAECIKENCHQEQLDYSVIYNYLQFAKQYSGYYYIGGHIKTHPDTPITTKSIDDATKINNESQPCHMMEVISKNRSANELNNLKKILEVYYEKCLEEYYEPPSKQNKMCGGEGYAKIAMETIIGKK